MTFKELKDLLEKDPDFHENMELCITVSGCCGVLEWLDVTEECIDVLEDNPIIYIDANIASCRKYGKLSKCMNLKDKEESK